MTKNCARNSHKIMGFSRVCGTCGAFSRMREYMGPELDQITNKRLRKFRSTHTLALSQTEHIIPSEEPVQSSVTGMLLVRVLGKKTAKAGVPRLSLSWRNMEEQIRENVPF